MIVYFIVCLVLIVEAGLKPRLDFGKGVYLWYGKKNRKVIIIKK